MTELSRMEEDYLDFLEQFGHIDFFLLEFLPVIRTVPELKAAKQKSIMMSAKMIRTHALLDGSGQISIRPSLGSMRKPTKAEVEEKRRKTKRNKTELSQIEEVANE